jgi:hypothetical protein
MMRVAVRARCPKLLICQVDRVPFAVVAAEVLACRAGIVASAAPPAADTEGPLCADEVFDFGLDKRHLEGDRW